MCPGGANNELNQWQVGKSAASAAARASPAPRATRRRAAPPSSAAAKVLGLSFRHRRPIYLPARLLQQHRPTHLLQRGPLVSQRARPAAHLRLHRAELRVRAGSALPEGAAEPPEEVQRALLHGALRLGRRGPNGLLVVLAVHPRRGCFRGTLDIWNGAKNGCESMSNDGPKGLNHSGTMG